MTTSPLIQPTDHTVSITVQQRSSVTPAEAFRVIAPIDLTTVFHPRGAVPRRQQCGRPDRGLGPRGPDARVAESARVGS